MSKQRLAELLRQLRIELAEAEDVDEQLEQELRAATEKLQHVVDRHEVDPADSPPPQGMIQQLRQAADRFEDSHPTITNTVGRIADALSQMGI